MPNFVSLIKYESEAGAESNFARALEPIGFKWPSSVNTISIKPNLCYYWNASTGQTTDPQLVGELVDYLREIYGADVEIRVAEADASAMKTKISFRLLGYRRLAAEKKVSLVNLSEDVIEEREIQVGNQKMALKVPQSLLTSDLFVNMPKLKVMRATHITCAMKNLFGAIAFPRKAKYHPFLAQTIVGVSKILKPHLNLVDGLVALGAYPVRLNIIMAGTSAFEVDWVAAEVMGYNPSKIEFLKLAAKEHLGTPGDIKVVGEEIETYRSQFPTENNLLARLKMRLLYSLLRTYARISGDIIPPSLDDV